MVEYMRGADVRPLILIGHNDDWSTRALESVLEPAGYEVRTGRTADEIIDLVRQFPPDALVLHDQLSGSDGAALCRQLRSDPAFSPATPVIMTTSDPITRGQQLAALRAGAWALQGEPLDAEELLARLGTYVQGKSEVDKVGSVGLLDPTSGLYNLFGTARRTHELVALTARHSMALACAVFETTGPLPPDRVAQAFKSRGRVSDVIGRLSATEFVVFAPGTDAAGAAQLVSRLARAVRGALDGAPESPRPALKISAGFSAIEAVPNASFDPGVLLAGARSSLAAQGPGSGR